MITKDEKVQKAQSPETNFNPDKKKQDVERDAHQGRKRRKDSVQERHHRYAYATKKKRNRSINSPADAKSKKFELRRQRDNCSILECCIDISRESRHRVVIIAVSVYLHSSLIVVGLGDLSKN